VSRGCPPEPPEPGQWMELGRLAEVGLRTGSLMHELRQPLCAVKALLQMDGSGAPGRFDRDVRGLLLQQVEQMEAILDAAVGQVRRPGGPWLPYAAAEPARAVHAAFTSRARGLGVVFDLHVGEDLPVLKGDPVALQQVLANLVQNALDAVAGCPAPRLELAVRRERGGVLITLDDNGGGIDPGLGERIFEPFFTTKPPGMGTGLGLAIARELVQAGGGNMAISSEPGRTRVSVRLPASAPAG